MRHPTDLPGVYSRAAEVIESNGYWPHDLIPDAFNRALHTPHRVRPMNVEAAIRCATAGDPHAENQLARQAIVWAAARLSYDDEPVRDGSVEDACWHLLAWGEAQSAEFVVETLRTLAMRAGLTAGRAA